MPLTWLEDGGSGITGSKIAATNDIIVASYGSPTDCRVSLDDGVTFSTESLPAAPGGFAWEKLYGVGGVFFFFADDGETYIYSTDGVTWNSGTLPITLSSPAFPLGMAYKSGVYYATCYGTTSVLMSTDGGATFVADTVDLGNWSGIAAGPDRVVMIGEDGVTGVTTDDGASWTFGTISLFFSYLAYGAGFFIAFQPSGTPTRRSTNGTSWTNGTAPLSVAGAASYGASATGVAIIDAAALAAYTEDGSTWVSEDFLTNTSYAIAGYSAGVIVGRFTDPHWFGTLPVPIDTMTDGITFSDGPLYTLFPEELLVELGISMDLESLDISVNPVRLGLSTALASELEGANTIADEVTFDDIIQFVYRELLAVSVELGVADTVDYRAIGLMVDRLILTGTVSTALEAHKLIVDALLLNDSVESRWRDLIADSVDFAVQQADVLTAMHVMVDEALFGVVDESTATLQVIMPDSVVFDAEQTSFAELASQLRDALAFTLRLQVDNGQYTAWTVNAGTTGHTRYTNYPFNGFMTIGSKYYGTSEQGLFRLDGADDDGTAITAKIRAGMSKLNSGNMKTIQSMYLGYKADGDLLVKVIVADDHTGSREAHIYKLVERGGGSQREGRVPIGRGLQSVYWDYEVENVDGADFELDTVEILPLVHERRVRGSSGGKA